MQLDLAIYINENECQLSTSWQFHSKWPFLGMGKWMKIEWMGWNGIDGMNGMDGRAYSSLEIVQISQHLG